MKWFGTMKCEHQCLMDSYCLFMTQLLFTNTQPLKSPCWRPPLYSLVHRSPEVGMWLKLGWSKHLMPLATVIAGSFNMWPNQSQWHGREVLLKREVLLERNSLFPAGLYSWEDTRSGAASPILQGGPEPTWRRAMLEEIESLSWTRDFGPRSIHARS